MSGATKGHLLLGTRVGPTSRHFTRIVTFPSFDTKFSRQLNTSSSSCTALVRQPRQRQQQQQQQRATNNNNNKRQFTTQSTHFQKATNNMKPWHKVLTKGSKLAPRTIFPPTSQTTWIISDGTVSGEKQSIALAEALGLPWVIKRTQWSSSLNWLPMPFKKLLMDYHHVVHRANSRSKPTSTTTTTTSSITKLPWFLSGDLLSEPFPSFVIGTGSKSVPAVLHVNRKSQGASFSAQIGFPVLPFIHFDQVFLQPFEIAVQLANLGLMKDQKNFFRMEQSLNRISPQGLETILKEATSLPSQKTVGTEVEGGRIPKSFFRKDSKSLVVTILMGGPTNDCSYPTERVLNRIERLVKAQNCRLLISFSQRTTKNTRQAIRELETKVGDLERMFVYDPIGIHGNDITALQPFRSSQDYAQKDKTINNNNKNPYELMLALADKIVVTADSVAMTCEAVATGKPVYVLGSEATRGKLQVFHKYLTDGHYTRAFRPGRILISPRSTSSTSDGVDSADPLCYPGDHPPWAFATATAAAGLAKETKKQSSSSSSSLIGASPAEAKKLAERILLLRESRILGRRVPQEVYLANR